MQEERPSTSMFRGFHQLTYLPHYLVSLFGWALPYPFSRAFSWLAPHRLRGFYVVQKEKPHER